MDIYLAKVFLAWAVPIMGLLILATAHDTIMWVVERHVTRPQLEFRLRFCVKRRNQLEASRLFRRARGFDNIIKLTHRRLQELSRRENHSS